MSTGFWWGNLRETYHLEELGVDGKIILKFIFKTWGGSIDRIDLAHDRDRLRAVVNTEIISVSIECEELPDENL